jgi:hypothetical protein
MRWIIVFFVLLLGVVQAQTQQGCVNNNGTQVCAQVPTPPSSVSSPLPDPIASTINFDTWMGAVGTILESTNAKDVFRNIGGAVLGIGAFFLAIQILYKGGLFEGFQFILVRMLIASAVFLAAEPLGNLWKDTWHWGYKYSTSQMADIYAQSATQLTAVASDYPKNIIKVKTITASSTGQSSATVQLQTPEESSWIQDTALWLIPSISGILFICLSGFYTFAVLSSAVIIILGKIIFPLIAATLIFPGAHGVNAFGLWAKSMTTAVISAFFLPLLYGIAGFISVIIPLTYLQNFFTYVDQIIDYMKGISQSFSAQGYSSPDLAQIASGLMSLWGIGDLLGSVFKFGGMLFVLPFAMIIGFLCAVGIIMKAGGWIASYIGGISTAGDWSNPVAGAVGMLWGGGSASAAGAGASAAGGAARAGGVAASSGQSAIGGAVGSALQNAGSALQSNARALAANAAVSSGGLRSAPAMNLATAGLQRPGSLGPAIGPGGAQVSVGSPRTSPTISPAAAELIQNRAISMASPDFARFKQDFNQPSGSISAPAQTQGANRQPLRNRLRGRS